MRVQRPSYQLTAKFQTLHLSKQSIEFAVYNSRLEPIEFDHLADAQRHQLDLRLMLPDYLIIGFSQIGNNELTMLSMSLAGITFNPKVLNKRVEYKPTTELYKVIETESRRELTCKQNGFFCVDFFSPDPFAYHLYVGNKITVL